MKNPDWEQLRADHDPRGVGDVFARYPEMLEEVADIQAEALPEAPLVVLSGMGGSTYAAELYRDSLGPESPFQLYVNRSYSLPAWVSAETPMIASSYSGNTEETLAAFDEALKRGMKVTAVSSGGELERRAQEKGVPHVKLPLLDGFPPAISPRLTLPYGFGALAKLLPRPGFEVARIAGFIRSLQQDAGGENPAVKIAQMAHRTLPSLYLDQAWQGVGKVWQAQLQENAKSLLEIGVLSEANHNEIQTWANDEIPRSAIFLHSEFDPDRIVKRFDFAREHLSWKIVEHQEPGTDRLLVVWGMMYLGLWVSYYLAMLRGEDPSDIDRLVSLKEYLKDS